jgi:apoptosis-inducing factor 3
MMDSDANDLTGPDLAEGIARASLEPGKPLLGHAEGDAVIVVQSETGVHAIGAKCTHYGGPLAEGLVVGDTVRCPWHHACFDLRTGEAVGAPALADVPCFEVVQSGPLVQVRKKKDRPARSAPASPSSVVIVGAGAAGAACVETLRKEGYGGPITMLGAEEPGPVDRPNLSKDFLAGSAPVEWVPLGTPEHYAELGVELAPNDEVVAIDTTAKTVTTKRGRRIDYGALLYATGAEPVRLSIPGATLPHVFTLRSFDDARAIIARVQNARRAVVVGSSFIGLEVAASLVARGLEVHVVGRDHIPLAPILGPELGAFVRGVHEEKGTRFHLGTSPVAIREDAVELESGETLACDLVVLGVGVRPRTALAERAGLAVDNGVVIDDAHRTSASGVWAAGDVARRNGMSRVEHWVFAQRGGQHVAREMLREPRLEPRPSTTVPFFWSAHHDVVLSYVGFVRSPERVRIFGSLSERRAAVLLEDEARKDIAVVTVGRDLTSLAVEAALERGDRGAIEGILKEVAT